MCVYIYVGDNVLQSYINILGVDVRTQTILVWNHGFFQLWKIACDRRVPARHALGALLAERGAILRVFNRHVFSSCIQPPCYRVVPRTCKGVF
jgi:hypothetical protein